MKEFVTPAISVIHSFTPGNKTFTPESYPEKQKNANKKRGLSTSIVFMNTNQIHFYNPDTGKEVESDAESFKFPKKLREDVNSKSKKINPPRKGAKNKKPIKDLSDSESDIEMSSGHSEPEPEKLIPENEKAQLVATDTSEYEKIREDNIKQKQVVFKSLGFGKNKENIVPEVIDKGVSEGPGTYQGRNTGKVSQAKKKLAKEQKVKRDKNKKIIANEQDILKELDESSDQSTYPATPQKKKTNKRVRKGAAPPKKADNPLPQVVTTPSFTGRHCF